MATKRGSRRARGGSWLERAATRMRKAMKETYVVRVANNDDIRQKKSSLSNVEPIENFLEKEKKVPVAVPLKNGETIKVELGELKNYLESNKDIIAFQHDPDMPTRRRIVKQRLQQSID